jgi:hypothetical protein
MSYDRHLPASGTAMTTTRMHWQRPHPNDELTRIHTYIHLQMSEGMYYIQAV